MGRAVNNAGAALVSNLSLSLIASNSSITLIITALVLFATVGILIAAYSMLNAPGVQTETGGTMTHKMQAACEANVSHNTKAALGNDSSVSTASDISSDPDYPQNTPNADPFSTFSTAFSLTDREQSVFDQLVNTEKSIQEIADSLFISEEPVSAISHPFMKRSVQNPGWDCTSPISNGSAKPVTGAEIIFP